MPKKKVDSRVRTLIENCVKTRQRSLFVVVGDRGKYQVVNLHYMLTKAQAKTKPSVLWCYDKELGFSTHRQKRMRQVKQMQAKGVWNEDTDDPFQLFMSSTNISWCYYKDSARILGQTHGMLVLQDFEALTPNLLCRTMETVEGGGIVVLLLASMSSLKSLYTMVMDVHARFRTEAHQHVVPRFNERFMLSLATCASALVVDDELNVLPISKHAKLIQPLTAEDAAMGAAASAAAELATLKASLESTDMIGGLVASCVTLDQAKAVLQFSECIADKSLSTTVALTAGRGRGKSAALGLAIAAALGFGYANIFVTSPSPQNLSTLFEFVFKGLDALAYKEHLDYSTQIGTEGDTAGCVIRVNVHRNTRQTVQYVAPGDAAGRLGQAELLVVDEAAAIPLPVVRSLMGPYLVFLASTVNGYEGTGRSLTLKFIQ
ncbi:NAT10, partial [Symbiodinium sp. KB8]